jgi:hypothetical protein
MLGITIKPSKVPAKVGGRYISATNTRHQHHRRGPAASLLSLRVTKPNQPALRMGPRCSA